MKVSSLYKCSFLSTLLPLLFFSKIISAKTEQECIGIDLGTTYSAVAAWRNNMAEIIPGNSGERITPSYVLIHPANSEIHVGDAAKDLAPQYPKNAIFDSKRLIGRKFNDPKVQGDLKNWPFEVVSDSGEAALKFVQNGETKIRRPEFISAMILSKLKKDAEAYLGQEIKEAVITVPAYFNDAQRAATKDAGQIAGLKVNRLLNEPTAAALAYGLHKKESVNVLVYDLGGGTFDVSVLTIAEGVFEVVATNGDDHLGGQDFDNRVIEYLAGEIKKKYSVDTMKDHKKSSTLRAEVEKAKRLLSAATDVTIDLESIAKVDGANIKLTRARFEDLNRDLFLKTLPPLEQALKDAKMSPDKITDILLVGGSTRIPKIRSLLEEKFPGKKLNISVNPDEAVAQGAAVQAAILMDKGAAKDLLVLDVTPLSLGIETKGEVMTVIIKRNTQIPVKATQIFSTASDNQTTVEIAIYEGERAFVRQNHFLGKFLLSGIPPAPRGVPQIEVTLEIDANGILKVTAEDKSSGKKANIDITSDKHRLKDDEIQRMVKEAEDNMQSDKLLREKIEAKNKLENYLYTMKSQVNDEKGMGGKLSADQKKTLTDLLAEKSKWFDENSEKASKEDFDEQHAAMEKIVVPIITQLSASGPSDSASNQPPPQHEDL